MYKLENHHTGSVLHVAAWRQLLGRFWPHLQTEVNHYFSLSVRCLLNLSVTFWCVLTLWVSYAACFFFLLRYLFAQMRENPLSLWIKETVCIMYTGGEGGTQKGERLRRRTVSKKIYEMGNVFFWKLIGSFWMEAVIHKCLLENFMLFLPKQIP